MTLAIGHYEHARQTVVLDCLREAKPPFSPEQVTGEFAQLLKSYSVSQIVGDRYAGGFPPEQFAKFGINYDQAAKPRSELYVDLLPLLNSRRIELLDHGKLLQQLCSLERRSGRNRDVIDHAPNGHDDLANAVAGLASNLLGAGSYNLDALADTVPEDPIQIEEYRERRAAYHQEYGRYAQPVALLASEGLPP
jgi:hypothetical protein